MFLELIHSCSTTKDHLLGSVRGGRRIINFSVCRVKDNLAAVSCGVAMATGYSKGLSGKQTTDTKSQKSRVNSSQIDTMQRIPLHTATRYPCNSSRFVLIKA